MMKWSTLREQTLAFWANIRARIPHMEAAPKATTSAPVEPPPPPPPTETPAPEPIVTEAPVVTEVPTSSEEPTQATEAPKPKKRGRKPKAPKPTE